MWWVPFWQLDIKMCNSHCKLLCIIGGLQGEYLKIGDRGPDYQNSLTLQLSAHEEWEGNKRGMK
jgi:hypothetical protein